MDKFAAKIDKLRTDRGWSVYRLAQETGIPDQTINKWLYKNSMITIPSLIQVCDAFGITLAEFFAEKKLVELSPVLADLYELWCILTADEKSSVEAIVRNYASSKKA